MKTPDLNLLIALDALLQEQNVSRAAKRLGLSTPAMSHALARLRKHLGDPLLVRAGQRMVPTPRAADLRDRVHGLADDALGVLRPEPTRDLKTLERTFRIKASDMVMCVLGPALDKRLRELPGVSLHVMPPQFEEPALLRAGTVDLAIGVYDYSPYSDLPNDLRIQQLFEDHFTCVVRKDHPTVGRTLTIEQYAALEHVQIAPRGQPGGYVDELLEARGYKRRIVRAVPFFIAALMLVAETDYVLTVSGQLARRLAEPLGLRLVQPPRSLDLEPNHMAQLWHPRNDKDPAHRWLRETIAEAARLSTRGR
ncbi:MAG TPA: LysR family transcriptional regulator [Kofleriaceae bacterium]|jgi:DNA-binding transcriptional LysR family regulator|nr:LysR family transcriptional regulator [Kofleriaceae bacterium]